VTERRAVYDALLKLKETGQGSLIVHFEGEVHKGPSGPELTGCNIYFVLPLAAGCGRNIALETHYIIDMSDRT
jgi:hypothetical protein